MADAYGEMQPLTALGQIALQGTTLVVRPFDPSVSLGRALGSAHHRRSMRWLVLRL